MTRAFLRPDDVRNLVSEHLGTDRRPVGLDRLAGGSKKGVHRLRLDDQATAILYVWASDENYWPSSPSVHDDPFTDASGADLFAVNHAARTDAGVRTPQLLMLDHAGRYLEADLALVEDLGTATLEELMERDPSAAAEPLARLGEALRRLHTTLGPRYGKLAAIARGEAPQTRRAEDIILDRARGHLDAAAGRDARLADVARRVRSRRPSRSSPRPGHIAIPVTCGRPLGPGGPATDFLEVPRTRRRHPGRASGRPVEPETESAGHRRPERAADGRPGWRSRAEPYRSTDRSTGGGAPVLHLRDSTNRECVHAMPVLLAEIDILLDHARPGPERRGLLRLRVMADRCGNEGHRGLLVFVGD